MTTPLRFWEGTSFAAPFVAGYAAIVKEMNSLLTPAQVKSTIVNAAYTGALTSSTLKSWPNKLMYNGNLPDYNIDNDAPPGGGGVNPTPPEQYAVVRTLASYVLL